MLSIAYGDTATMLRTGVLVIVVLCIVGPLGTNSQQNSVKCGTSQFRRMAMRKYRCINSFVNKTYFKLEGLAKNGSCRNFEGVERKFRRIYNHLSECFIDHSSNKINLTNITYSSLQTRIRFMIKVFEEDHVKEFLSGGGVRCIKQYGQTILDRCILNVLANESISSLTFSLTRMNIVRLYNQFANFRQGRIANCTRKVLEGNCSPKAVNFIMSLHKTMNGYYNESLEAIQVSRPKPSSRSKTWILLGSLVCVGALLVLAVFAVRKIMKRSKKSAQNYSVGFEAKEH